MKEEQEECRTKGSLEERTLPRTITMAEPVNKLPFLHLLANLNDIRNN